MNSIIYSVAWFEKNRPEMNAFVQDDLANTKHAIVCGKPKVGKSEIPICEYAREQSKSSLKLAFVSNFRRKDCRDQRDKYSVLGIESFFGYAEIKDFCKLFKKWVTQYKKIIVYIDESDYGTSKKQYLNDAFELIFKERKNPIIFSRFLSATNHEALMSDFMKIDGVRRLNVPLPPTYRGLDWFIDRNLIKESSEFFEICDGEIGVTTHGREIINEWLSTYEKTGRTFAVVRAKGKSEKEKVFKKLRDGLTLSEVQELIDPAGRVLVHFVDDASEFYWGPPEKNPGMFSWTNLYDKTSGPKLILLNECCSRSTEVGFHPIIDFWHDNQTRGTSYSTYAQAIGRMCHFEYTKPNSRWTDPSADVKIYCCPEVAKLLADRMDAVDFTTITSRDLHVRTKTETDNRVLRYKLLSSDNDEDAISEAKFFICEHPELCEGADKVEDFGVWVSHTNRWKNEEKSQVEYFYKESTAIAGGFAAMVDMKKQNPHTFVLQIDGVANKTDEDFLSNNASLTMKFLDGEEMPLSKIFGKKRYVLPTIHSREVKRSKTTEVSCFSVGAG